MRWIFMRLLNNLVTRELASSEVHIDAGKPIPVVKPLS